jgi:ParB family transcriptional regulator, chromosome partitioning protein
MERRLGRGLGSLLGGPEPTAAAGGASELEIDQIQPNPYQPRKSMDPTALAELRDSIRIHGVLQPVVVRRKGERYELVAGERRWRAARMAGLTRIPASIRENVAEHEMLELALVENLQRQDLDPIERARGYRSMMERLAITQESVAGKVGLNRATVANHLRLLELPSKIQEAVSKGLLTMGHARAMLGIESQQKLEDLLEQIVREDLSVRDVERSVRSARPPRLQGSADRESASRRRPSWAVELERRLREALGTKVTIECGPDGAKGRIQIEFFSQGELDRVCEKLAPRSRL